MVNSKTTAVRVIPAVGKKAGEELDFGGLLGSGPIMAVNPASPAEFIHRGGKIPRAPAEFEELKPLTFPPLCGKIGEIERIKMHGLRERSCAPWDGNSRSSLS